MSETPQGLDTIQDTITVNGIPFNSQLGIGAMKWLIQRRKKNLADILAELELTQRTPVDQNLDFIADLLTAMRIQAMYQARIPVDLVVAEAEANSLSISEMRTILERGRPSDFEPKNSPTQEVTVMEPSNGPSLSTT